MYDFDLLCLGSGPAGQRAAVQAAKLGRRSAIVEKGRIVGGVCVDTGTIPSKTFREAVIGSRGFAPPDAGGTPEQTAPSDRSTSSWRASTEVSRRECDVIQHQLERNDVDVIWGTRPFRIRTPSCVELRRTPRDDGHREHILDRGRDAARAAAGRGAGRRVVLTSDDILTHEDAAAHARRRRRRA